MRRRDKYQKKYHNQSGKASQKFPSLPYSQETGIIGMVSVKTIRGKNGSIIIKQGERISEDTLREAEVLDELKANAMPIRAERNNTT